MAIPDRHKLEMDLERELDHCDAAERQVAEQRTRVTYLEEQGFGSDCAKSVLRMFEESLKMHEEHRDIVTDELRKMDEMY